MNNASRSGVDVMIELCKTSCGHTGEEVTNPAWMEHWKRPELSSEGSVRVPQADKIRRAFKTEGTACAKTERNGTT